jgi:hypothetical protein
MGVRDVIGSGLIGSLISLVGVVVAVIIYKASRVGARPVYQERALRLVGPDARLLHEAVEIRFKGQLVERLTKTHMIFWNSGRVLLRGSDVVHTDPVRCDFADGSCILEVRVLKRTRDANKFEVHIDPERQHRAILAFDYLDPGDGVVLEMLHTDLKRYPMVNGTIRGVPNGIVGWGRMPMRGRFLPFAFRRRPIFGVAFTVGVLFMTAGTLLPDGVVERLVNDKPPSPLLLRAVLVACGALYSAGPLWLLWVARRRFPRNLNSPELEEY